MSSLVLKGFPGLKQGRYTETSPATPVYNCIAWAAGDSTRFWWPRQRPFMYWPYGVPEEDTLSAFRAAFETIGYAACADEKPEAGFEKVAIYADASGRVKHAARLLPTGQWTSKLGRDIDISHELPGVAGDLYGQPKLFMKRSAAAIQPPVTMAVSTPKSTTGEGQR